MANTISLEKCATGVSCTPGKFKRVNYFHGMLLTEQDFQDEQCYIRAKIKLHNRLHGAGVVCGLRLLSKCIKVGEKQLNKIFIEAGFALGCDGNEIIVCHDHLVPLDEKIADLLREGKIPCQGNAGPKLFVGIRYCECQSDPVPQYTSACDDDELHQQYSRVREGYAVQVLLEEELASGKNTEISHDNGCTKPSKDCPGLFNCAEKDLFIVLGSLNNYSTVGGNFPEGIIDPNDRRTYAVQYLCRTYLRNFDDWEKRGLALLASFSHEEEVVDFTGVLDKQEDEAILYAKTIGLARPKVVSRSDIRGQLQIVRGAMPIARRGGSITLVLDDDKKVIFAYASDVK
jgi:hypothetical protein